jgi:hypothetical protein
MTTQPGDPWADPGYRPELAPPMSDSFYRAIGDYCRAENAEAEPSFIGGLPEDRITVTAEHEIAAANPDEPVPFTLTDQAEAALDATEPEPEAEP